MEGMIVVEVLISSSVSVLQLWPNWHFFRECP
jgi:hypothetical protein